MNLYLALVHHPIKNKNNELVTTSVTNMDIHDIGRSCKTFGIKKYFIITPIVAQHELVERILEHWNKDESGAYNPDRQTALGTIELQNSVEDAVSRVAELEGKTPQLIATGANFEEFELEAEDLGKKLQSDGSPGLILFGTGWGIHDKLLKSVDYRLAPIRGYGADCYNHLSVRSAVAIYLDRVVNGLKTCDE